MAKRVLVIPDLHFPWHHMNCLNFLYDIAKEKKPDVIIQIGDLYDFHAFSKFARTHNLCTPQEELEEGRAAAEAMWKHFRKICPDSEKYQIKGNHDSRVSKRVLDVLPEIESLLGTPLETMFKFEGVKTINDVREELIIDGVAYCHGHYSKIGDHSKYLLKPVVHGHRHRGEVWFQQMDSYMLWELDAGFCADATAVPMRYTPGKTNHWTLGGGWVDGLGPRFMPFCS